MGSDTERGGRRGGVERKQGQGRGWLPKQISYINLSLTGSMVFVHVLYECVCSHYIAATQSQCVRSHFNTVAGHVLLFSVCGLLH